MPKNKNDVDEAIGPVLDGLDTPKNPEPSHEPEPESKPEPEEIEIVEHPVVLLCGHGLVVDELGKLAETCGFILEFALLQDEPAPPYATEEQIFRLDDYDNFASDCMVDRNYFVCIFCAEIDDCVAILRQCLESDASYLGLYADENEKSEIYAKLREAGAPDAELAAIGCPIGLNIGARTPEQLAVGVIAQILATSNGTTKRLTWDN
ncbi:MAG: XdhC/CoxF family protein [Desulfovibrio sp.]|nr:XdhC/CoxF family protein [Desulfovibrio sp.]